MCGGIPVCSLWFHSRADSMSHLGRMFWSFSPKRRNANYCSLTLKWKMLNGVSRCVKMGVLKSCYLGMLEGWPGSQHCKFHTKESWNWAENISAVEWLHKLGLEAVEFGAACLAERFGITLSSLSLPKPLGRPGERIAASPARSDLRLLHASVWIKMLKALLF